MAKEEEYFHFIIVCTTTGSPSLTRLLRALKSNIKVVFRSKWPWAVTLFLKRFPQGCGEQQYLITNEQLL